jgi:hypothetical protein
VICFVATMFGVKTVLAKNTQVQDALTRHALRSDRVGILLIGSLLLSVNKYVRH